MKRMLINATQPEEIRVALVDGQRLYDLDIENRLKEQKKDNIYKGKITRVEPSLEAAFVDYGSDRHGFLPLKEISREYFIKQPKDIGGRIRIQDVLKEGMEVVVQVSKEERGNKGAALTTFVSLAGRYLVLMPNNPRGGGISRRIEGTERAELKEALSNVDVPNGMSIIVRTAGVGRRAEDLQWDMNSLTDIWDAIKVSADAKPAPNFLFQESNVIIRAIRDYLRPDVGEVIVDQKEAYDLASTFVTQFMPKYSSKVKLYEETLPLFNRFQIESQIETAFEREVKLPSGGSIVIDVTEALISIDINSSRATKGGDIEETALNTNVEAADEIARQLRLRDMGGLVVIDFIDMQAAKNQREVENRMRDALEMDRARVQVGRISKFGLLEMSRQRLRPSLSEMTSKVCPRCSGQGTIRGTKSIALSILRLVEEEAQKETSAEIRAVVPVNVGTYLLNEKRHDIAGIELRQKTRIMILPSTELVTPHFEVQRLRDNDIVSSETSYKIDVDQDDSTETIKDDAAELAKLPKPAVQFVAPARPAPEEVKEAPEGFLSKLIKGIKSFFTNEEEVKPEPQRHNRNGSNRRGGQNNPRNRNRNRNRNNGRRNENKRPQNDEITDNLSSRAPDDSAEKKDSSENRTSNNGRKRNNRRRNGRRPEGAENQAQGENTTSKTPEENTRAPSSREKTEGEPNKRPNRRRGRGRERKREDIPKEFEKDASNDLTASNDQANQGEKAADEQSKPAKSAEKPRESASSQPTKSVSNSALEEDSQAMNAEVETALAIAAKEFKNNSELAEHTPEPASASHDNNHDSSRSEKKTKTHAETPNKEAAKTETSASEEKTVKPAETQTNNATQATEVEAEARKPEQQEQKTKPVEKVSETPEVEAEASSSEVEPPKVTPQSADAVTPKPTLVAAETQPNNSAPSQAATVNKAERKKPERAGNDPRLTPKPVRDLLIANVPYSVKMSRALDTSLPAKIESKPRPLARAANDPRQK